MGSNGRKTFFNQVYASLITWRENDLNKDIKTARFADDSDFPEDFLRNLHLFISENKIQYKWEKGDFFFIDNSIA